MAYDDCEFDDKVANSVLIKANQPLLNNNHGAIWIQSTTLE